jgi:8-oxo-dGDP phosphatase
MTSTWPGPIADQWDPVPIIDRDLIHQGAKWNVVVETVEIAGHHVRRDIVVHPGAVAIVVLDDLDQVFFIRQYRQPLGAFLFETPAGLLDDPHEAPLAAAKRELAEEAGLVADTWHVLVDFLNSPGGSSEAIRVYLARGISQIDGGRHHTGEAEEVDLPGVWVDLDKAVHMVLSGLLGNPTTVVGVLAAQAARTFNWTSLREASSPWKAREELLRIGRLPVPSSEGRTAVV